MFFSHKNEKKNESKTENKIEQPDQVFAQTSFPLKTYKKNEINKSTLSF